MLAKQVFKIIVLQQTLFGMKNSLHQMILRGSITTKQTDLSNKCILDLILIIFKNRYFNPDQLSTNTDSKSSMFKKSK